MMKTIYVRACANWLSIADLSPVPQHWNDGLHCHTNVSKSSHFASVQSSIVPKGCRNTVFWIYQFLIGSHVVFHVTSFFIEVFSCNPWAKLWDPTITNSHCVPRTDIKHLISTILNVGSDLILLALSQYVIWSLRISTQRAATLSAVFFVGIV